MSKLCLKKLSKRVSLSKKHKIVKKVREHHRKLKKESKLKAKQKRKEKPISVPNKCPFKEDILLEAEKHREQIAEQKELKKERSKMNRQEAKKRKSNDSGLGDLAEKAARLAAEFDSKEPIVVGKKTKAQKDASLKVYAGEVRKTIETADIIIQVLDCRDPLGSRSKSVEQSVVAAGKRLVLLLNKIDLVPKENVKNWLKYLRADFPTIAFKASTQEQNNKLGRAGSNLSTLSSKCIGAELVMKLLANYCRNKDIKTSIRVGVVGYPNVGKSSVINSLKRKRSCNVGAAPGVTKQMQEIELDKHIRLLDSPGVVLATKNQLDAVEVALKNAVRVEALEDPVAPVQAILRRCTRDMLMIHYNIPEFGSCDEFLALVARKLGRLKKGARPDINAAARHVLTDWNTGKLRYYTEPPERETASEESAQLVTELAKEFDLDALDEDQSLVVAGLPQCTQQSSAIPHSTSVPLDVCMDDESLSNENSSRTVVTSGKVDKNKDSSISVGAGDVSVLSMEIDGNAQVNRNLKRAVKRARRLKNKNVKRTTKLADALDAGAMDLDKGEEYDFKVME